jgi:tRNA threonylcarbamoyladenosine biosynthesis protein TsaE
MQLGALLRGGELLLLDGQLGTGKTTFTQGLAKGMGIIDIVSSPTFTLLKEYTSQPRSDTEKGTQRGLTLYHFDLYRLDNPDEIIDLGFEDYFYGSDVCVVEWAAKADLLWPAERLHVRLRMMGETGRGLLFTATGQRYYELLRQFHYATASS